jgi:hypothetical protein
MQMLEFVTPDGDFDFNKSPQKLMDIVVGGELSSYKSTLTASEAQQIALPRSQKQF